MEIFEIRDLLLSGLVIPAHPLALKTDRTLDERRQRALTRYYLAAGAGGIAVGVHTTQFWLHDPSFRMFKPVLELAAGVATDFERRAGRPVLRIAGLVGRTRTAVWEATAARTLGYHAGLLSLAALQDASDDELIAHCRAVAEVIPLFGFYLQPSVGGRPLGYAFWRRFADIERVVAIKIAPFDRYRTLDVMRAVADSGRSGEIALYTGNDDSIVHDLATPFRVGDAMLTIAGGLLGQWAVWTRTAVRLLQEIKQARQSGNAIPAEILAIGAQLTDANSAIFDAANGFAGCIPGIHDVLRRQGLLADLTFLDPRDALSPGQPAEIDRVLAAYPHLADDDFVRGHLDEWMS